MGNYQDLLDRVKKAVPFLQGVDDQQIIISYKNLSLRTFINFEAIIQLVRFVPVLNQTSTGQLCSLFSQASWYDYNVC